MTLPLKPKRGGFLRPFGCGEFIRDFLLGKGPYGSLKIEPRVGTPQATIFRQYKLALMREIALDKATRTEERTARKENRGIDPEKIQKLADDYFVHLPYKTLACRFHSFVVYFSDLQEALWQYGLRVGYANRFFDLVYLRMLANGMAYSISEGVRPDD